MSAVTNATLVLDLVDPKLGPVTRKVGGLAFDAQDIESLIPVVMDAAKREQVGGVVVTGFRFEGEAVRHVVDATYSDNSGTWYEHRDGVYPAEAALQGALFMAGEEGVEDVFLERLKAAQDIRIDYCAPEPVTKEEYRDALSALVSQLKAEGHESAALDEVSRLLALDGVEVEAAPAPGMR